MDILIWALVLALVGLLAGWLAPLAVGGRRPYGLGGDLAAGIGVMVGLGLIWHLWLMPYFDFPAWLNLAAIFGDPLFAVLIVLWLMRKLRPAQPAPG